MAFALWWRKHCRFDTTNNGFIGRPFCLVHIKRGYTQVLYICDLAIARIGMASFCSVKKHEKAAWTVLRLFTEALAISFMLFTNLLLRKFI